MYYIRFFKYISLSILLLNISNSVLYGQVDIADFFNQTDAFLSRYTNSGSVSYSAIQKNKAELDSLLEFIQRYPYSKEPLAEQKAYLINSYNLMVINGIVNYYPVNSPQSIEGFFDKKTQLLAGEEITLNALENNIIKMKFRDPRMHFVLVCGAKGCPPLASQAYLPATVEIQLEDQTRRALNDPGFIRVADDKQKVYLSEIFKWYDADFNIQGEGVLMYINSYRTQAIPENYGTDFYTYDWLLNDMPIDEKHSNTELRASLDDTPRSLNLQTYTPSSLLKKGQWEYKFFNNLYTQTKGFDADGNKVNYMSRGTYFSSIHQFLIGITPKLNIGADLWIKSVRLDSENSSPFALLQFQQNSDNARTAISGIGPKIKISPFKRLSHFTIQSTYLIPVARDQEGQENNRPFLSADRHFLITQFFYDQPIGDKFQLFFQISPWLSVNKKFDASTFSLSSPGTVFFSWFANKRVTVYFQNEFWPFWGDKGIDSWFRQEGLGVKFQLIPGLLETEFLYTQFSKGVNAGAGQTYNWGIRIIH